MPAGNYNSANLNSANYRTEAASASPSGNYYASNFDSLRFRTGESEREFGNFTTIGFNTANFRALGGTRPAGSFRYANYAPENFLCEVNLINVADSGTTLDATAGISADVSVSDAGAGTDAIAAEMSATIADSGAAVEADVIASLTITDSGAGADVWQYPEVALTVSDSGAGVDAIGLTVSFTTSDVGAGSDIIAMTSSVLTSDSGSGIEVLVDIVVSLTVTQGNAGRTETVSITASVPVSQSGSGVDNVILTTAIPVTDSGANVGEVIGVAASITVTQTNAGRVETVTLWTYVNISQVGAGAEVWTLSTDISVSDVGGPGVDIVSDRGIGILDPSYAAEFVWRLKGYTMIDDVTLPHVLRIQHRDDAEVDEKHIQGGTLPLRRIMGKRGRIVEVDGWSKVLEELTALEALQGSTRRMFLHPSGESFAVLVSRVYVERTADRYSRRRYRITLLEVL